MYKNLVESILGRKRVAARCFHVALHPSPTVVVAGPRPHCYAYNDPHKRAGVNVCFNLVGVFAHPIVLPSYKFFFNV